MLPGVVVPMPTLPKSEVVALLLPIVIPVAVDVPIAMVLELSITTPESPVTPVLVNVSAANAEPEVSARTPSTTPTMRGQLERLSFDDFIF